MLSLVKTILCTQTVNSIFVPVPGCIFSSALQVTAWCTVFGADEFESGVHRMTLRVTQRDGTQS